MAAEDRALRAVVKARAHQEQVRREANRRLKASIKAAHDAGWSYERIGRAIGVSHVAVLKMLRQPD